MAGRSEDAGGLDRPVEPSAPPEPHEVPGRPDVPAPPEPPEPPEPPAPPEPPGTITLDARSMRGIAHPLRTRMLGLLRSDGPSTATRLAQRLGLSSAATSYHLRQLAAYGFVAEDEGRGTTRERWWRSVYRTTHFDSTVTRSVDDEEERAEVEALSAEYLRSVVAVNTESLHEYLDHAHELSDAWHNAASMSDGLWLLTPEETRRLNEELDALIGRYRRADSDEPAPPGACQVRVGWQVYPRWVPGGPDVGSPSAYEPPTTDD